MMEGQDNSASVLNEFSEWRISQTLWGSYSERSYQSSWFKINELKTAFINECKIAAVYEPLPSVVNFCLPLTGYIGTQFKHKNLTLELANGNYHNIYSPACEYELLIKKEVHGIHIEIDLKYFIGLLNDTEHWSSELKSKIGGRDFYYTGKFNSPEIKNLLIEIINTPLQGSIKKLFVEAKMMELLSFQFSHLLNHASQSSSVSRTDRELGEAVKQYLSKTFSSDHSLQALARQFVTNEFRLKKVFKAVNGVTVFEFIFNEKMNYARHLMLDKNMLVREAASAVGYKNPNHFSTAFKRKFGVNPMLIKK